MKYKVGDKVRVKKDLIVLEYYDNEIFVEVMRKFLGKSAVITETDIGNKHSSYGLDIDNGIYYWTDKMLEDVETDENDIVTLTIKQGELTISISGSPKYETIITQDSIRFIFKGKEAENVD